MGLIGKILGKSKSSVAEILDPAGQMLIIDGPSVFGADNKALAPRDQVAILHRLSRFNQAEKINAQVLFEGEPLDKVGHGERFDELTVYFAPTADDFLDQVSGLLKQKGSQHITLVSSDRDTEALARKLGVQTLRADTFRRAFDRNTGRGRRRRGRSRGGKSDNGSSNDSGSTRKNQSQKTKSGSGQRRKRGGNSGREKVEPRDAVSELIDLVD